MSTTSNVFQVGARILRVAALSGLTTLSCSALAGWHEIKTDNYVLLSEEKESQSRQFIENIVVLEKVLTLIASVSDFSPAVPMRIYAMKSSTWDKYFKPKDTNIAGYFRGSPYHNDIVFTAGDRGSHIALHEYSHFVVSNSGTRLPTWINEGLAEFLASVETERKVVVLGRRPVLQAVPQAWIPLPELLAARSPTEFKNSGDFYRQSWSLVHYHMFKEPARLMDYAERIRTGESIAAAHRSAFGIGVEEMDVVSRKYERSPTLTVLKIERSKLGDTSVPNYPSRDLSDREARHEFAELLLRFNKAELARGEFKQLIATDGSDGRAYSGLAQASFALGEDGVGDSALARALELAPNDPMVLRRRAIRMSEKIDTRGESLEWFRKALAQGDYDLETLYRYARVAADDVDERPRALQSVASALRRAPKNVVFASSYAILSERERRLDQALAGWSIVARYALDASSRDHAMGRIAALTRAAESRGNVPTRPGAQTSED